MKKLSFLPLLPLLAVTLLLMPLSGCDKSNNGKRYTYTISRPIYSTWTSVLATINGDPARSISAVGKIYVKGSYIFVNEMDKGIHVIDNSNPSHPVQAAFLAIPGNEDIAVKDNILYADMYDQLLAIDITDLRHVKVTSRLPGVFVGRSYGYRASAGDDQVIIGMMTKDTTVFIKDPSPFFHPTTPLMYASFSNSSTAGPGVAGSMAKMVLLQDHLYALAERHTLQVINLENAAAPLLGANLYAGFDLETIYPFRDKLFLGSSEGVYICDISNPSHPSAAGKFTHGRACDPVVTDGDYAYVTLHTGTFCGGASNELDVVNVKDLMNPALVKTYEMTKPMGLAKDGNFLFVCDGAGVKVFDAADPGALRSITTVGEGTAYDVIAAGHRLLVSSDKGIYQYDYSKAGIPLLSVLPVVSH